MRKPLENFASSRRSLVEMLKGLESGKLSAGRKHLQDLISYMKGVIDTHNYTRAKKSIWISLISIFACFCSCLSSPLHTFSTKNKICPQQRRHKGDLVSLREAQQDFAQKKSNLNQNFSIASASWQIEGRSWTSMALTWERWGARSRQTLKKYEMRHKHLNGTNSTAACKREGYFSS